MSTAARRLLPCCTLSLLAACALPDRAQDQAALLCGLPTVPAPAGRPIDPCGDGGVVVASQRLLRQAGPPTTLALPFDTAAERQACLTVTSGGAGHRVASAWFEVDGQRLLGPEACNQQVAEVERRFALPAGHHTLTGSLRGPPGTWADVTLRTAGDGGALTSVASRLLTLGGLFADPATFPGALGPTHLSASGAVRHPPGHAKAGAALVVRWRFEVLGATSCALVRTLRGESPVAGDPRFEAGADWDGLDEAGHPLDPGPYAYRLVAELVRGAGRGHGHGDDDDDDDDGDDDDHSHGHDGGWCARGEVVLDTLATPLQLVTLAPPRGFVDLHTHPLSYLGFGEKAVHGAPDLGLPLPAGSLACNERPVRATSIDQALGSCNGTHGGWGLFDNTCGDFLRAAIINKGVDGDFAFQTGPFDHQHAGYPDLAAWPHQTSILHQQMWWEWVQRAHQGGLQVMVALTVNNELLAELLNGNLPYDDRGVADRQIAETRQLIANHPELMELALSSADVVRIVGQGKLAVVLGMEVDRIGNFGALSQPSDDAIRAELRRLHGLGIRYVFPVHLVDNAFGGAAVYSPLFSFANKRANGYHFLVATSADPLVTYDASRIEKLPLFGGVANASLVALQGLLLGVGFLPAPCFDFTKGCPPGVGMVRCCGSYQSVEAILSPSPEFEAYGLIRPGHVNALGLTRRGEVALDELMKLGMLIDVDHMSERSMERAVELAEATRAVTGGPGYPLLLGHTGLRGPDSSERLPARRLVERVAALGGMVGAGTSDATPDAFIQSFRALQGVLGPRRVGLGTDVDGFQRLPRSADGCKLGVDVAGSERFYARFLAESPLHARSSTGNRTWDYILDCGAAHYGLLPEFLFDVEVFHQAPDVVEALRDSTTGFIQLWRQVEDVSARLP